MRQGNEVTVGFFTLGALILLLYGWGWLKSFSLFSQPQRFAAEFTDVAGLSRNSTVNVQGVRVGTVEFMEFEPSRKILIHIKITDPTAKIVQGSKVTIQTLGLVGAKYVEIVLPHDANGNVLANAPVIPNGTILRPPDVEDPVRTELIVNRVASRIDEIVSSIDTSAASNAINNLNQASTKLNHNMDRLKDAANSVQTASNNIAATSSKFGKTADNATIAAERASSFFSSGTAALKDVQITVKDFRGTSQRVNKLLDNPNFSGDLKETMLQARQTAEVVRGAIGDVNVTLKDKELRTEVLGILTKLQQSTDNIRGSMEIVNRMANDQGLRADLKDTVTKAKEAMEKASNLLGDPAFKDDVKSTMSKVRSAATNVDVASKQIQQVLSKRAPLLQMLFGRPGKITPETLQPKLVPVTPNSGVVIPSTTAPLPGVVVPANR